MSGGATPPQGLVQEWVHSHEEDTAGQQVFRPGSYNFPPSRGRFGFALQADGHYVDEGIAPNDGTNSQPGTWTWSPGNQLTLSPASGETRKFSVVSVAPDRLVLTPVR